MRDSTDANSKMRADTDTDIDIDAVQSIGSHCDLQTCNRLDFLPFKCESCGGTYCLDHRTEIAHTCAQEGRWASLRAASNKSTSASTPRPPPSHSRLLEAPCACPGCKTTINTIRNPGVNCSVCRRSYCLVHRLQDAHSCDTIKPVSTGSSSSASANQKAKAALSRFKAWTSTRAESLSLSLPSSSRARPSPVAEVAKLKRAAKGDEKIPLQSRIYVNVEAEAKSTTSKLPSGQFYYGKDWTVGRVLDKAAQALQVQNVNNRDEGDEKKLRVFHVEGGRVLGFGEKLGECVVSGNTLVLLRGVQMVDLLVEE